MTAHQGTTLLWARMQGKNVLFLAWIRQIRPGISICQRVSPVCGSCTKHTQVYDADFVVSRGGEYIFAPSISALSGAIAA